MGTCSVPAKTAVALVWDRGWPWAAYDAGGGGTGGVVGAAAGGDC